MKPIPDTTGDSQTGGVGYKALLASILVVALVLRLPGFNESLWYDELWSTRLELGSLTALVRVIGSDVHPPFYSQVMFVWIRLFGDSEISVRIVPLICGLVTIVFTAQLAAYYAGRRAGLAAAMILAISPPHIWYSQEARQYSLLLMLLTGYTIAFHQVLRTHARRWYIASALLGLAMVMTHYFAIVYVAAITLLALRDPRARARMLWIGTAIATVLALFLVAKWRLGALPTRLGYLRSFGLKDVWKLMFEWYVIGGALGTPEKRPTALTFGVLCVQLALLATVARGLLHAGISQAPGPSPESRWGTLARRFELALLAVDPPRRAFWFSPLGRNGFTLKEAQLRDCRSSQSQWASA